MHAVLVEHHDFAVLDVAHVFRADDVERAGLRGEDRVAVELADHQRADAERIARADQLLVGEADEGIGAFELAQRVDEAVDEAVALGAVRRDAGSPRCRWSTADGAVAHELAAQRQAIGEIAVVADRKAAGVEFGEQRLHVAQDGFAGGRIAHMAERRRPGRRSMTSRREKLSPTRPIRRSEWKRLPSKVTMPAASWPRCWSACRPSAVIAAASGWPKMPKTPHSSRSRSPSRSSPASPQMMLAHRIHLRAWLRPFAALRRTAVIVAPSLFGARPDADGAGRRARVRGSNADPASARRSSGSAASAASRWCFPGHPATATSASRRCPAARPVTWRSRTHGLAAAGTSQSKNRKATTTMISPRAEPEQKAERAVERADAAVEDHVGEPDGHDRDDQQRAEEHAGDHHHGGDDVVVEIALREGQELA